MPFIEVILVMVIPAVIAGMTQLIKNLPVIAAASLRVPIIRAIVAILSLLSAVMLLLVGDITYEDFDPGLIETAVLASFNALVATGVWIASKKLG